nr:tRNA pseudouridine(13) synthase TruD [Candidatus Njordarchaeum guaymaensis]
MLDAPKTEQEIGIEVYATSSKGIGGVIRQKYEDFIVKEISLLAHGIQDLENTTETSKYSIFWLEKRGLDTILAVRKIAKKLRVSEKRFSFAGMKDRNALTLQQVSAWNIPPERLKEISLNRIRIKEVSYSHDPVNIGSHWGNQFQVAVRKVFLPVKETEYRLQKTIEETRTNGGIPNFFGHQRFGLRRPITHLVGLEMLKGNLKDAAMVFLSKNSPYERDEVSASRAELWATMDFKAALNDFPNQLTYELAMLRRLSSHPDDFVNAFKALPRRLLQMFVHATQAWLFNKFMSRRLKKDIRLNQCLDGDLVAPLDDNGLMTKELIKVDDINIDMLNEHVRSGKAVVVYPVPGFDMTLPRGVMYEIVREVMDQEGLIPRSFWVNKMPEISSTGTFRPAIIISKYFKVTPSSSTIKNESKATFEFSLARGSYATVVLREFMKNDDPLAAGY